MEVDVGRTLNLNMFPVLKSCKGFTLSMKYLREE